MDAYEAILTNMQVREFAKKHVDDSLKTKILQAARFTGSSSNTQHWHFILIQDPKNIETLAKDSTTGRWITNSDFAVIVLVDPTVPGSGNDGGRALQDMELAAWNFGVASGMFTGIREPDLRRDFNIPQNLKIAVVLGFGYPAKKLKGKKSRKPIEEIVSLESYGKSFHPSG
jgi:nitroreductase